MSSPRTPTRAAPTRPSPLALAVAACAGIGASGCGLLLDLASDDPSPEHGPTAPSPGGPGGTDLGTATYPPGAITPPALHTWTAKSLKPNKYRLGYALEPSEGAAIDAAFRDYTRRVGYRANNNDTFRWVPPPGCSGDMHCVYAELVTEDASALAPVVERFRARRATEHLSTMDLAVLIVTFVQNIEYEIPGKEPFGILPPALVVSRKKGDCDSKALVAHVILGALGYDTVMLSSTAHKHAMLGIVLPVQGTKLTFGGRGYAFTELTARGSPIGHVNPSLLRPNDWKAEPFRFPVGTKLTSKAEPSVPPAAPSVPTTPKRPRPRP